MKIRDIIERYGLADEPAQNVSKAIYRKTSDDNNNQAKRAADQSQNSYDEYTLKQTQAIGDQIRDQQRRPTGIPARLLQPQPQIQAPQTQQTQQQRRASMP
jgi:hypothetical protein